MGLNRGSINPDKAKSKTYNILETKNPHKLYAPNKKNAKTPNNPVTTDDNMRIKQHIKSSLNEIPDTVAQIKYKGKRRA